MTSISPSGLLPECDIVIALGVGSGNVLVDRFAIHVPEQFTFVDWPVLSVELTLPID
jgi:hypothetical protein